MAVTHPGALIGVVHGHNMFYASRTIQASRTAASVTPLQRAGTLSRALAGTLSQAMIHMPKFVQAAIDVADEFFFLQPDTVQKWRSYSAIS